jgi:hypothetical protein
MKKHTRNLYKIGSLRVWNIINPPNEPVCYPVRSPQHGKQLINSLADSQLLDKNIECNVFGMEVMEKDGEWCEWEDSEGYNITDDECSIDRK